MPSLLSVSDVDLRTLAGIVQEKRTDVPEVGLPPSLLGDLVGQIRCDELTVAGFDSHRQAWWLAQTGTGGGGEAAEEPFPDADVTHWCHYWDCQPCSYPDRTADLRSVVTITDFYSARQWHSTGMYTDYYRPLGIEHELMLCMPAGTPGTAGPGRTLRIFLFRGPGPDFSERDRALLTLLRPHLHEAYLDAEQRRHPAPRLTPRQWQLLHLLAAGHTNIQIARRLGLSEGTVRKHLENAYRRLHVSNRMAAVARAFPAGAPHQRRTR
ncbi:helix-turn-helix transcriptional regulator [Actinacidiphila paucisporea]|uniref:Regulatory protein, luxR family n=1 Tax=Actinacidiphila paucisporea TaxID=310782 RepID=A0A1M6YNW3_9ACTN|nr:response regulator transcription factor [Actinacidiphila paucisporea]SHL19897.1 regulatory protein, luxR family [Actinacidiphila paucisporea]